ncbi:hypothetical protein LSAT2_005305 [Lamellibrachia satsuma]|nr:hypothetical protein LSAT2_005305 [Lamellibrachia satsuma]
MYTWLGLYNEARTHIVSQCNWTDGAPVVYHRYASPRTSRVAGHCVIVDVTRYGRGTCAWRDVACDSRHAVTCSRLYLAPLSKTEDEYEDPATSGTTAADRRPSARAMGYVAIVLVLVELWCVVMLDWNDFARNVGIMKKNVRNCLRSKGNGNVARSEGQRKGKRFQNGERPDADVRDVVESLV